MHESTFAQISPARQQGPYQISGVMPMLDLSKIEEFGSCLNTSQISGMELEKLTGNNLELRVALQLCSRLLDYPEPNLDFTGLQKQIKELRIKQIQEVLQDFWEQYQEKDFDEQAELYVATFDFNPSTCLYLTARQEDQEEKNRGLSLLQMKEVYKENGLELLSQELPDYLPAFLEFLSIAPLVLIQSALKLYRPALEQLASELDKVENLYSLVMDACLLAFNAFQQPKEDSL